MILKRELLPIALFFITAVLTGFTSGNEPLPKKVGLITVYTDPEWNFSDARPMPAKGGERVPMDGASFLSNISGKGNIDHRSDLTELKNDLLKMPAYFQCQFVDENTIVSASVYETIGQRHKLKAQAANRYVAITGVNKSAIAETFTIDPTMDGVMLAWVKYTVCVSMKQNNRGSLYVQADLFIQLFNREGKKVAKWSTSGNSFNMDFRFSEVFGEEQLGLYCSDALVKAKAALPAELKKSIID